MDQAAFTATLQRDGYLEILNRQFPAGHDLGEHNHPFDARALILAGEFTIGIDGQDRHYRAGDVFEVPAGCRHTERSGSEGVSFLVGRRR
jgi:quercetin dioxygenase-like cupin family protein